jgi:ankyrin repeat protein
MAPIHNKALLKAAQRNNAKTIRNIIKHGAEVNIANKNGDTSVYIAAEEGHLAVVRALIELGADVNIPGNDGITPVFIAAQERHMAVVKVLVQNGADVNIAHNNGNTPVSNAVWMGHMAVVRALIDHGADVNIANNIGVTPVSIAAHTGHMDIVRALVEHGADVNIADNDGFTPVWVAAQNRHLDIVKALAEHGAEINGSALGQPPVLTAASFGRVDTISLLYALGANMTFPPSLSEFSTEAIPETLARAARASGHEEAAVLIENMLCELAAKKCHHCGLSPMAKHALFRCGVCNTTLYCSRDCQGNDWKEHKPSCRLRKCSLVRLLPYKGVIL